MTARRRHGEKRSGGRSRPGAAASRGAASSTVFIGGPHAVRAALDQHDTASSRRSDRSSGAAGAQWSGGVGAVERLYLDSGDQAGRGSHRREADRDELVEMARAAGIPVSRVPKGECDRLAGVRAQGVAAEISYAYADFDSLLAAVQDVGHGQRGGDGLGDRRLLVFLDGVEDPHNLGAIIRTAEAAGALAVVIQGRRSAQVTPAVARASAGAAMQLPVCRVTNLVQAMRLAREAGYWLVGLDHDAAGSLSAAPGPGVGGEIDGPAGRIALVGLVVGGEGQGLRRLVVEGCDELARLPMRGRVESLNASVAASIAIYRVCEKTLFDD